MAKNYLADNVNSYSYHHTTRTVLKVVKSVRNIEGGGFIVNRALPTHFISAFDPFLLLDERVLQTMAPEKPRGLQTIPIEALKP
jgi:hypothetical protein